MLELRRKLPLDLCNSVQVLVPEGESCLHVVIKMDALLGFRQCLGMLKRSHVRHCDKSDSTVSVNQESPEPAWVNAGFDWLRGLVRSIVILGSTL
jgi:hypothetical protein